MCALLPRLRPCCSGKSRLVIPASGANNVSTIAAGTYQITVSAKNSFAAPLFQSVDAVVTLTVANAGDAPVINIVGPTVRRTFMIKDGIKITTSLVPESVCPNTQVGLVG